MSFWNRFTKRLTEMHEGNKAQLEANNETLAKAEIQAEVVRKIRDDAEQRSNRLRDANRRNHYSEGLTKSMRGNWA